MVSLSGLRFNAYVGHVLPAIHATKYDLAAAQEAKEQEQHSVLA